MAIKIAGTEVINDNRELVLAKLTEIDATIADTAVDIFVYDTRKDSDGGAWRKRTQHTSWYNETLNTATRGSRKEFPAVAVIVAESNQVTIYDGDDPDLPMWMVFNQPSDATVNFMGTNARPVSAISMLNGNLCVGFSIGGWGISKISFISDLQRWFWSNSIYYQVTNSVSERNVTSSNGYAQLESFGLVDALVNDVAMTVLPNAPIDAATGLPVPTIAVATAGGVSVIKDDGTVVDVLTSSGQIVEVTYNKDAYLWVTGGGGVAWRNWLFETNPTSDGQSPDFTFDSGSTPTRFGSNGGYSINKQDQLYETVAFGKTNANSGPAVHLLNDTSMVAFIDPSYNTGWMNGDIKLATLSDTDDTNVTFTNLVSNGDFATGVTGWTASGDTSWSYNSSNQTAQFTGTSQSWYRHTISTESGAQYVMTFEIKAAGSGVGIRPYIGGNTYSQSQFYTAVGVHSVSFVADGTSNEAVLNIQSTGGTWEVDNVTVSRAEEDRSVNGNGLQVFGTVTKSAVATGADLVAYSGWSGSNYLQQPYNSDLDFGTGDVCFMGWVNHSSQVNTHFVGSGDGTTNNSFAIGLYNGQLIIRSYDGSAWNQRYAFGNIDIGSTNGWMHIVVRRSSSSKFTYFINGVEYSFTSTLSASNWDLSSPNKGALFGYVANNVYGGSLALWRISATAPSPEQIKKIYEDEKVLFQEGAKAVLAGTSDSVTSLAYDDDQQELLVGTSQYTSVFRGLRRVEEISGSASAISASNGLRVIED